MSHTTKLTAEMDRAIGQAIKAARIAQGISQTELASVLGVSFQQQQKFESGRNRVNASALVLMCKRLKISPMDILGQHFGEPSEMSGLVEQITSLKQQLTAVRAAIKG